MILILDFDDTLLNTKQFWTKRMPDLLFSHFKITHTEFKESRETLKEMHRNNPEYYDLKSRIELLGNNSPEYVKEICKKIYEFTEKETKNFLFNDTVSFLKKYQNVHTLILMTFGDPDFQRHKVVSSGIAPYFSKLIFTGEESKATAIKKVVKDAPRNTKIVFLDDRIPHLRATKKTIPRVFTVRMKRKEGRYNDEKGFKECYEVTDLNSFAALLESIG